MKQQFALILLLLLCPLLAARAQSGLDDVLKSIETNNPTLRANRQLAESQKLEARTGNYLANPTVEYSQLWPKGNTEGSENELVVKQSFDFPSVYAHKNKLARIKSETSDLQYAAKRQEILLNALETCQEIIFLKKQKALLDNRLTHTQKLEELYRKRLASGDANQLELNKIQLEKINAQYACRRNEATMRARLENLQLMNGGMAIDLQTDEYPPLQQLPEFSTLEADYLSADPALKGLTSESEAAQREIKINRALSLPKFDIGYRCNGNSEEKLNGFCVGVSIPLWENKNTVKQAKAQAEYAQLNIADNTQVLKATLKELYLQAQALQASKEEYTQVLSAQRNEELLHKALEAGQMTMTDYFAELFTLYDSIQNYLEIEKEYYNTIARLLQYRL